MRADAQLREADRGRPGVGAARAWSDAGDGDRDRPGGDLDELALAGQRLRTEVDVLRRAGQARPADVDGRDHPVRVRALWLQQLQDALSGGDGEEVADRVTTIGDHPSRRRVAVDGHRRALLGAVGERLSIAAGLHDQAVLECRDRLVVGVGNQAEDRQALVALGDAQHVATVAAGLGEPADILRAAPVVGTVAVGVGDDDNRAVQRLAASEVRGVAQCLVAAQQAGGGGVEHTIAAAHQHDHPVAGSDDGDRVRDRHEFDGGERRADGRVAQRSLIDHWDVGYVRRGHPVRHRLTEADGLRREQLVNVLRAGRAEAIEGEVVRDPDRVGAQVAGDGRDRVGVERVVLHPVVERVEQVHHAG